MRSTRILAALFAILFVACALSVSAGTARADGTAGGSDTTNGGFTTTSVTWCRTC